MGLSLFSIIGLLSVLRSCNCHMKKLYILFLLVYLGGCSQEKDAIPLDSKGRVQSSLVDTSQDIVIDSYRWGLVGQPRVSWVDNPIVSEKVVECSDFAILPEHSHHIWLGNVLYKNSLLDLRYRPIPCKRNPIVVSLTLKNTTEAEIDRPTKSKVSAYISNALISATFPSESFFHLGIERFESYEELKRAFGYNVKTSYLLASSERNEQSASMYIRKATGLYIRFLQTSFKAVVDYPEQGIADIPKHLVDSAVYINTISYGRMGILAMETDEDFSTAQRIIEKGLNVLFLQGNKSLSEHEQQIIDKASFRLYIIGGEGQNLIHVFDGYKDFLRYVSKSSFSPERPGVPILYTLNNARDDAHYRSRFRIRIKNNPIYVYLEQRPISAKEPHLVSYYLSFFKSKNRLKTFPPIGMSFVLDKMRNDRGVHRLVERKIVKVDTYQSQLLVESKVSLPQVYVESFWDNKKRSWGKREYIDGYYYVLRSSDDGSYEVLE